MIKSDMFLRQYCLRKDQKLPQTRLLKNSQFSLPNGSILYYMSWDSMETGISGGHGLLLNCTNIRLHHEEKLLFTSGKGTPKMSVCKIRLTSILRETHV